MNLTIILKLIDDYFETEHVNSKVISIEYFCTAFA